MCMTWDLPRRLSRMAISLSLLSENSWKENTYLFPIGFSLSIRQLSLLSTLPLKSTLFSPILSSSGLSPWGFFTYAHRSWPVLALPLWHWCSNLSNERKSEGVFLAIGDHGPDWFPIHSLISLSPSDQEKIGIYRGFGVWVFVILVIALRLWSPAGGRVRGEGDDQRKASGNSQRWNRNAILKMKDEVKKTITIPLGERERTWNPKLFGFYCAFLLLHRRLFMFSFFFFSHLFPCFLATLLFLSNT